MSTNSVNASNQAAYYQSLATCNQQQAAMAQVAADTASDNNAAATAISSGSATAPTPAPTQPPNPTDTQGNNINVYA